MNFRKVKPLAKNQVNQSLDEFLPGSGEHPAQLHQAIRYSVHAGGKRLRPILVLAAHELYPGERDPIPAAMAMECIHTYSLIHDDLPAMDDSDLRRGEPACHKKFDDATAILAGDALQPMAFECLSRGYARESELGMDLVRILAETAGSKKLVGGQMQDLISEGKEPDAENLRYIHENKTAAMIRASLEMGFRIGSMGRDAEKTNGIRRAGTALGWLFRRWMICWMLPAPVRNWARMQLMIRAGKGDLGNFDRGGKGKRPWRLSIRKMQRRKSRSVETINSCWN